MKLSDAAIGRFKVLWREHYGEDLTDEQAHELGGRLIRVVKVLADPAMHQKEKEPP